MFISDNFFPESNALANRLYGHARIWVKNGCAVTVLTCVPNFPKGNVFEGYKNKWRQVENIDGIKVIRIKSYLAANKGSLKRILDYMSFAVHAAIQGLFVKKPDIVVGTSPQPFPVFSAWFVARMKRKPFIFELRDLWPESIIAVDAMGKANVLLRFFGWGIKRMYHAADVIVSVTDSFKKILSDENGIKPDKIVVCKNGVAPSEVSVNIDPQVLRQRYRLEGKYLVGYVGTIGMAHSVDTILQAAKQSTDAKIHFVIMGQGADSHKIKEKSNALANVTFIDGGNRQDAVNITNMLDACIVHLRDTPLFRTVIPSKIFEVMALGKPILMGVAGEAREIVIDQAQAGIPFQPQNAENLNRAIDKVRTLSFDAEKVRTFVKREFDRDKIALRMLAEIGRALSVEC